MLLSEQEAKGLREGQGVSISNTRLIFNTISLGQGIWTPGIKRVGSGEVALRSGSCRHDPNKILKL